MSKKPKKEPLTSQKKYAESRGMSRQRVNYYVKKNLIKLKNGKVDPAQADKAISENVDPSKKGREKKKKGKRSNGKTPAANIPSFILSKAESEYWKAKLQELDYKTKSGELLEADEVRNAAFSAAKRFKDRVYAALDRVAPFLDNKENRRLRREIDKALK